VIVTVPDLVSEYLVEQLPLDKVQASWLKLPLLLLVPQVIVPVELDPETKAVHMVGEPTETGLGEQITEVEEMFPKGCMSG
jgi:hypothetical protein